MIKMKPNFEYFVSVDNDGDDVFRLSDTDYATKIQIPYSFSKSFTIDKEKLSESRSRVGEFIDGVFVEDDSGSVYITEKAKYKPFSWIPDNILEYAKDKHRIGSVNSHHENIRIAEIVDDGFHSSYVKIKIDYEINRDVYEMEKTYENLKGILDIDTWYLYGTETIDGQDFTLLRIV